MRTSWHYMFRDLQSWDFRFEKKNVITEHNNVAIITWAVQVASNQLTSERLTGSHMSCPVLIDNEPLWQLLFCDMFMTGLRQDWIIQNEHDDFLFRIIKNDENVIITVESGLKNTSTYLGDRIKGAIINSNPICFFGGWGHIKQISFHKVF